MTKVQIIRVIFQLIGMCFFGYQMQESLTKYLTYPIVTQLSGTTIAKIQKPYVYICEEGQFRFNHSKLLGYDSATDFLAGFLNTRSDQSSWRGKYEGGSFENISKKLYIHDYSNLRFNDFDDDGMKNLEVKMFLICSQTTQTMLKKTSWQVWRVCLLSLYKELQILLVLLQVLYQVLLCSLLK